jgi:hypothetical protein
VDQHIEHDACAHTIWALLLLFSFCFVHIPKCSIASHRIASHRIASHRIASHRIASHRIALRALGGWMTQQMVSWCADEHGSPVSARLPPAPSSSLE